MHPIIRIQNIAKSYRIAHDHERADYRTLREALVDVIAAPVRRLQHGTGTGRTEEFWALRGINLDIQKGEVFGIIGRNGAGKSTLLKILSRIVAPTRGRIELRGRVGSLLEVGTGFHPELTGRENIYLNGSILGMTRREIATKFDEIVDFSGVEKFLDTPVKRYSSGMYVRLAFAVAAHLEPEILLVDEVLAVGDATYQRKCINRMRDIAQAGRTVLFVSHNMDIIPELCSRAVCLESGQVLADGPAAEIVNAYLQRVGHNSTDLADVPRSGDGRARFVAIELCNETGHPVAQHVSGQDLCIRTIIDSTDDIQDAALAINVASLSGTKLCSAWTRESNYCVTLERGENVATCTFKNLPLRPGHRFVVQLWAESATVLDSITHSLVFDVVADSNSSGVATNRDQGCFLAPTAWHVSGGASSRQSIGA